VVGPRPEPGLRCHSPALWGKRVNLLRGERVLSYVYINFLFSVSIRTSQTFLHNCPLSLKCIISRHLICAGVTKQLHKQHNAFQFSLNQIILEPEIRTFLDAGAGTKKFQMLGAGAGNLSSGPTALV